MSGAPSLVVVGPGRLGRSVAGAIEERGGRAALAGREPGLPDEALSRPGLTLLFTVPDDALAAAAAAWAGRFADLPPAEGRVALHSSGVDGAEVLDPLRARGFSVGGWHPLVAIAAPDPSALRGVACGIRGDEAAAARGRELAERVGATPLPLADVDGVRYHAAAVFASNFLVASLAAAVDELARATGGEARIEHLLPLARAALAGVEEHGLRDGLTGPVRRGDVGTVRRHLERLSPDRGALYRHLARELLVLAGDRLAEEDRRELERLIAEDAEERTG